MELIWWGNTVQDDQWRVEESTSCGFLRVYYILSGKLTYEDETGSWELQSGQAYVFPSHRPYIVTHDPTVPFQCVWLHINALPYILQKLIWIPTQEDGVFRRLFSLLEILIQEATPGDPSLVGCSQILVEQLNRHEYFLKIDHEFYELVEELRAVALGNVQIHQFARDHGYSSEHFIRLFQQKMGQSPYQFVINCKMTSARYLLRNEVPISKIWEGIGYSDVKNFDKAFKKKHGMSATAYRKYALRRI